MINDNFSYWSTLYKESPERFDEERIKESMKIIDSAPKECRKRLEGLLWQINTRIKTAKNPYQSMIQLNTLMMDSLVDLQEALNKLLTELDGRHRP